METWFDANLDSCFLSNTRFSLRRPKSTGQVNAISTDTRWHVVSKEVRAGNA
jgi:hypothetical protein